MLGTMFACLLLLIAVPLVLLLAIGASFSVAKVCLEPLEQLGRGSPLTRRFQLSDLLCLILLLQLSLAPWAIYLRMEASFWFSLILIGFVWSIFGLGWLGSVDALSRAGIASVPRRCLYLCVVAPLSYGLAAGTFFAVVAFCVLLFYAIYGEAVVRPLLIIMAGGGIAGVLIAALRWAAHWIAQGATTQS